MEFVLRSPQMHSTFGNLGCLHPDGYHVNENCNAALETILHNILTEDKYLRTYRRFISFGQNMNKDLIPLLIHAKEDKTIELLIRILVNLTIPVECLLSLDVIAQTDSGRHTISEINSLLGSTKAAFTDNRTTKVVIEFLKKNADLELQVKLSKEKCTNVSNSLLLLRNILHIPEDMAIAAPSFDGPAHAMQNQILWNIFGQNFDKVLIKLMNVTDATNWGVTMVQIVALLYKDQHVVTLYKFLNMWIESRLSESSEDNESNTSPPDRCSEDSSPILTSDPTSDSSDTCASRKSKVKPNSVKRMNEWDAFFVNNTSKTGSRLRLCLLSPLSKPENDTEEKNTTDNPRDETMKSDYEQSQSCSTSVLSEKSNLDQSQESEKKILVSENSDCGYATQIDNQESISTSSNEDELPAMKPAHHKPHTVKLRMNNKVRAATTLQERKRKKMIKRGKVNTVNVPMFLHKTSNADDISNVLTEFTFEFLLKGYNSLVQTLHSQILTNVQLEIDTSHFFWLVTYFLKFATQIKLDLERISCVLSFDIVSYLISEGVNVCEQLELAIKLDGHDLKPCMRRLHLVVTAIRDLIQAIDSYKSSPHVGTEDRQSLVNLQIKMCETEELRSLFVLLIRNYNPKYCTKQYLQDIIVTNHILLMFLDETMKLPEHNNLNIMVDHLKQFATPQMMYPYGLLLEEYTSNGEFVNDCVFTMMHHVGAELGCLISLFQPIILKSFTNIWKSEFEICDDWTDLIEYVINTFLKKPQTLQGYSNFRLDTVNFDKDMPIVTNVTAELNGVETKRKSANRSESNFCTDRWTEEEMSSLSWNYMQCCTMPDIIGEIVTLFKEDCVIKSRNSVIQELFKQILITKEEFENLSKRESKTGQVTKVSRDGEIGKLCDQLSQDGKSKFLDWVQKVLLEICFVKIYLEKQSSNIDKNSSAYEEKVKIQNFELFKNKSNDLPVLSPVAYHSLNYNQSVPLIPWNCEQASICKDLKFLQLLHKLGFHMPVDTGKVFIRIPNFWTADLLYEVAGKISPIDTSKLKFSIKEIKSCLASSNTLNNYTLSSDLTNDTTMISSPENLYQIHEHFNTMVQFTQMDRSEQIEVDEINKQNWLDVVQKSQDCKLIMKLGSAQTGMECDAPMGQSSGAQAFVPPPTTVLVLPTVMSTKLDSTALKAAFSESECSNNCAFETASVASDLTHMWVSDEEEKPVSRAAAGSVGAAADDQIFRHPAAPPLQKKRPHDQFPVFLYKKVKKSVDEQSTEINKKIVLSYFDHMV